MQIPKDVNTRAEAMWRIISREVDFRNKRVIDFGCGTGDFLWRAYVAGAEHIYGIDKKGLTIHIKEIMASTYINNEDQFEDGNGAITYVHADILKLPQKTFKRYNADIAFCFSVLPYLGDISATLEWLFENFALCLIEAQYEPEPYNIGVASDTEMASLLTNNGFNHVKPLGFTYVEIRDAKRTIWLCSKEKLDE